MKLIRTLALLATTALLLTACGKDADEATTAAKTSSNPLLAYVPADTAYVFTALEPTPKEITDAYASRFEPVMNVITKRVEQFQADYQAGHYADNKLATLATAVLDELGGKLNAESLQKLGISAQAHHAMYAMGVFPVVRLELMDTQKLRDAIGRIETKMGFELPVRELNGTSYWRVVEDDMPAGLYIAILDKQLAISVFPVNAEDRLLAPLLGQEMPDQSLASTHAIATMNSAKGYTSHGSGYLDLQKLATEILDPKSATHTFLGPLEDFDPATMDAVCVAEIKSIIAKTPRMTLGTTQMTTTEIGMRYNLEMESSLASSLAALVSDVPAAIDGDNLFSASLALNIGKLRSFAFEKAKALVASPYQCSQLQELNQNATELVTQLNIPMPPMVNNLMGIRARVDDIDLSKDIPSATGLLALHVDKPEMFVGMASMMLPGFAELDLANQSEPVRIPPEMLPVQGFDIFAMMNDHAIGASVGDQREKDLAGFIDMEAQNNGTFLSFSYDTAKQMEIQKAMTESLYAQADAAAPADDEFSEAVRETYAAMLDRSRVDMRFTADGLVIDSKVSFK